MKKNRLILSVVFIIFLGSIMGCSANRQYGYGKVGGIPEQQAQLPSLPATETKTAVSSPAGNDSELAKAIKENTETLKTFLNQKAQPENLQSKKLEPGSLSSKEKGKKDKTDGGDKYGKDIAKLKERIAKLELNDEIEHGKKTTVDANYKSAECILDCVAQEKINKEIANPYFDGKIDIIGVQSYASIAKPKKIDSTNAGLLDCRTINVINYLKELNIPVDNLKILDGKETDDYRVNTKSTLVIQKISDESEIAKRKEERKQQKENSIVKKNK